MKMKKIVKRICFILITGVIVPCLFFITFEFVLKVIGYGYPSGFFVRQTIQGKDYYTDNFKFSWRFFPKPMARASAPLFVPVKKDKDAYRIFFFGESAAMGDPESAYSMSRHLAALLEKLHPDKKIEVYNTAVTAINSNVIVPIVKNCLDLQPDIFILYMGNNEVIGPYGLSSALTPFYSSRWIIKMQIWLSETRTGQLFHELVHKNGAENMEWKGMELFMKNNIRYNNPRLQIIYNHFSDNIKEICHRAASKGVKVILSTVVSNEKDCAPFTSLHKEGMSSADLMRWEQFYRAGIALDSADINGALRNYEKACEVDSDYAELNFRMGKCYYRLQDYTRASSLFFKARDYDALRFRCDGKMNAIIRNIATENISGNVFLADPEKSIRQQCTGGIAGNEVLYEHVHLNMDGNKFVAATMLSQLEKIAGFPVTPTAQSLAINSNDRLVFTFWDMRRISELNLSRIQSPPFTNQYTNSSDISFLKTDIAEANKSLDKDAVFRIKGIYQDAVKRYPDDWFLHFDYFKFLNEFEYYTEASVEAGSVFNIIPYEYLSMVNMGISCKMVKKYNEAVSYFSKAINLNPYFTEAYLNMAYLYEEEGRFEEVVPYLIKGRSTADKLGDFYTRTGIQFAKVNKADSAIRYFTKAVAVQPGSQKAKENLSRAQAMKKAGVTLNISSAFTKAYNRANALFKQNDFVGAIDYYNESLRLNPSYTKAHNNLGIALIQVKKYDDAMQHFYEAIRLDPTFIEAYLNLGLLLESQGRYPEAVEILSQALNLKKSPEIYHLLAGVYMKMGDSLSVRKCLDAEHELRNAFR